MLINHCPACWRVNADDAQNCVVCGADLGEADTVRLPLQPKARPHSAGALWLDDLVGPQVGPLPRNEIDAEPFSLTLRDLTTPEAPASEAPAQTLELVQSDPETQPTVLEPTSAQSAVEPTPDIAARMPRQQADRRATVRRGRQRREPAAPRGEPTASDVLVVGAPNPSREELCAMLQAFGFTVQATDNSAEALARAASPSLRVAFVSAELHADTDSDGNGLTLCSRLRQADAHPGGSRAVLVLVVENLRPMDRVRAELAGCDDALPAPITRGSVARLLNARGINLPTDPRRN